MNKCNSISDYARNNGRDNNRHDKVASRHTNEVATNAGQCRAKNKRNGWFDYGFHKLAMQRGLIVLLGRNDFFRAQRHWAEQAGFQRLHFFGPMMPRGEGEPAGRTWLAFRHPLRDAFDLDAVPLGVRR